MKFEEIIKSFMDEPAEVFDTETKLSMLEYWKAKLLASDHGPN